MIQSFRDLLVWQKAMILAQNVYEVTAAFPKEEQYGLVSQLRRCAVSVPSNIAEGYGRQSLPDYIRFLKISRGSLFELQTQLELSCNLQFLKKEHFEKHIMLAYEIAKMLNSLIASLEAKK